VQGGSGQVLGHCTGRRVKLDLKVVVAEKRGVVCDEDREETVETRQIH